MSWSVTRDLDVFLAAAGAFLHARSAEHSVQLTVLDTLRMRGLRFYGGPPLFGWWLGEGGAVGGALLRTPPHPFHLTALPAQAVAPLAELIAGAEDRPDAVELVQRNAAAFAAAWPGEIRAGRASRLHRLEALEPPEPAPPGRVRTATPADRELLIAWGEAFTREAGGSAGDTAALVDDRLSHEGFALWEREEGAPVSVASITRRVAGSVRVSYVYTPSEHRRRGYAAAVTAAISARAQEEGAREVVLFTDLANPTSNEIYRRIGYRPVLDRLALHPS
ncbi:GNAT family N-acetyltransferase [Streptomyces radicis]|uniref:GNAT family N-acetyltransferase n=1 Tax=Streptomyces radicis TaxID=1750517 RepID=A0A3A9VTG7_9ACTN|nr:GNAT family N-acetyltransferase [Streptomyces radicis]RKN04069.1 GNAT family N-acetyltransferase [Streptomyces radicis]RKN14450.1 GNAT family N-acetyltransferase [Streptomyces radicis]